MRIFYLRNEKKVPFVCVASEKGYQDHVDLLDPVLGAKIEVVNFAVSTCHPVDEKKFSKKLGLKIAEDRLAMGKYDSVPLNRHVKWDIVGYIAKEESEFPTRARHLAQAWLDSHTRP